MNLSCTGAALAGPLVETVHDEQLLTLLELIGAPRNVELPNFLSDSPPYCIAQEGG